MKPRKNGAQVAFLLMWPNTLSDDKIIDACKGYLNLKVKANKILMQVYLKKIIYVLNT